MRLQASMSSEKGGEKLNTPNTLCKEAQSLPTKWKMVSGAEVLHRSAGLSFAMCESTGSSPRQERVGAGTWCSYLAISDVAN